MKNTKKGETWICTQAPTLNLAKTWTLGKEYKVLYDGHLLNNNGHSTCMFVNYLHENFERVEPKYVTEAVNKLIKSYEDKIEKLKNISSEKWKLGIKFSLNEVETIKKALIKSQNFELACQFREIEKEIIKEIDNDRI